MSGAVGANHLQDLGKDTKIAHRADGEKIDNRFDKTPSRSKEQWHSPTVIFALAEFLASEVVKGLEISAAE